MLAIYLWALLQTRAFSPGSAPERTWDPCKSLFCRQMQGPCHHWTLLVPETRGRKEFCHVYYAIQYYVRYSGTDISVHNNGSFTSKSSISPNENSGMSKCPLIFLFSSLINHSPDKRYHELHCSNNNNKRTKGESLEWVQLCEWYDVMSTFKSQA